MSDLFESRPSYYNFLSAMEQESLLYKEGISNYSPKLKQLQKDYRNIFSKTVRSIKTPGPLSHAKKGKPKVRIERTLFHLATSFDTSKREEEEEYEDHTTKEQSKAWPLRPTPAKRIFQPQKIKEINEDFPPPLPDLPVIHSTGIQVSNRRARTSTPTIQDCRRPKPRKIRTSFK